MLAKPLQHSTVSPLVFLLNLAITQIRSCGHPPVDLIIVRLGELGTLKVGDEFINVLGLFVLGGEQGKGGPDGFAIFGIHKGWMTDGSGGERRLAALLHAQRRDLATPAELDACLALYSHHGTGEPYTQDGPFLNAWVLLLHGLYDVGQPVGDLLRSIVGEKAPQLLLLLLVIRREPRLATSASTRYSLTASH